MIRLTEEQLHRVIKESVKRIIKEMNEKRGDFCPPTKFSKPFKPSPTEKRWDSKDGKHEYVSDYEYDYQGNKFGRKTWKQPKKKQQALHSQPNNQELE